MRIKKHTLEVVYIKNIDSFLDDNLKSCAPYRHILL